MCECNADLAASFEEVGSGTENIAVGELKRLHIRQVSVTLHCWAEPLIDLRCGLQT